MNHTIKQYAAILSIALSLASPHAAAGGLVKNFYVTSTIDAKDHVPGDGMCNAIPAQSGVLCTLRAAVMEGNATGELWDVNIHLFPGMTYSLSLPGLDGAAQGDLDIVRNMWIGSHGAGPKAAIDANGMQRVFSISGDGAQIENVEIFGGSSNGVGAAITSDADDVTLNRVDIHGNDGIGGVLHVSFGALHILDSRVHENSGIAILVQEGGYARVERTTLDGNDDFGITVEEGGIADISASTISNNTLSAINIYKNGGVWVRNSTLVNKLPGSDSPLLRVVSPDQQQTVHVDVRNSILSAILSQDACAIDEKAPGVTFVTQYNLYSDLSCGSDTPIDHSLHNTDAKLSKLDDLGGLTPTRKPLPGSPAIDRAPALSCSDADVDQRGFPRPVAYEFGAQPRCDIGAVELSTLPPDEPPPDEPPPDEPPPVDPALPIFADSFEGCDGC